MPYVLTFVRTGIRTYVHTYIKCDCRFFVEAVQVLEENVKCAGIFRKAGSVTRQKATKVSRYYYMHSSQLIAAFLRPPLPRLPSMPVPR